MRIKLFKEYAFDIRNYIKLREGGTFTVQVLEIKRRLFLPTVYTVISLQTGETFKCGKKHLTPIIDSQERIFCVRYPLDTPPVTKDDVQLLESIKQSPCIAENQEYFDKIEKLKLKLEFYSNIKDV